jgi:GrpB-like predicted nucleotidyltransferase (UPF0157 family)
MTDRVTIIPYDPDWPRRFDEERRALTAVFAGTEAVIEHVGSTAVPGLGAKPVIDILVGVPVLVEVERRIPAFEAAGYEYVPEYEQQLPDRRYFRKPRVGPRAFHVHCVITGSDFWIRHLTFRDYLRTLPASAAAYDSLKRELAIRVSKEAYTEAKSPFIENVLASAMRGRHGNQSTAVSDTAPDDR